MFEAIILLLIACPSLAEELAQDILALYIYATGNTTPSVLLDFSSLASGAQDKIIPYITSQLPALSDACQTALRMATSHELPADSAVDLDESETFICSTGKDPSQISVLTAFPYKNETLPAQCFQALFNAGAKMMYDEHICATTNELGPDKSNYLMGSILTVGILAIIAIILKSKPTGPIQMINLTGATEPLLPFTQIEYGTRVHLVYEAMGTLGPGNII